MTDKPQTTRNLTDTEIDCLIDWGKKNPEHARAVLGSQIGAAPIIPCHAWSVYRSAKNLFDDGKIIEISHCCEMGDVVAQMSCWNQEKQLDIWQKSDDDHNKDHPSQGGGISLLACIDKYSAAYLAAILMAWYDGKYHEPDEKGEHHE